MTRRTVEASSFEEYLANEGTSVDGRNAEDLDRKARLLRFPHSVMLKVSFAELDFANRWCWQRFGPSDGECLQRFAEYRMCDRIERHLHVGTWTSCWFEKTSYNFGFNEWYFAERADHDLFVANVDEINWGENYP